MAKKIVADNSDPDGSITKRAVEKVVGYVKKVFRPEPLKETERAMKEPTYDTYKNRQKKLDDDFKKAPGG